MIVDIARLVNQVSIYFIISRNPVLIRRSILLSVSICDDNLMNFVRKRRSTDDFEQFFMTIESPISGALRVNTIGRNATRRQRPGAASASRLTTYHQKSNRLSHFGAQPVQVIIGNGCLRTSSHLACSAASMNELTVIYFVIESMIALLAFHSSSWPETTLWVPTISKNGRKQPWGSPFVHSTFICSLLKLATTRCEVRPFSRC